MSESANLFEAASRQKLRFESPRGLLAVEDLWDLPLTALSPNRMNLDSIAIALHNELKVAGNVVSFVDETPTAGDATLELKLGIVKHIIATKKGENAAAATAAQKAQARERILAEMDRRRENRIGTMSDEELSAELAKL